MSDLVKIQVNIKQHVLKSDIDDIDTFKERFEDPDPYFHDDDFADDDCGQEHTSYLSRTPRTCPCKFFLAGVHFYRFNAKNWHFRCKFYSPKILTV